MTDTSDRRRRIVRIRTVEHRIAQQGLANAIRGAQQIGMIVDRIGILSRDNHVAKNSTDGASLASISEMATRLERARRSTTEPLGRALSQVAKCRANSMQTNAKTEGASRLLEKAVLEKSADTERRDNAARCYRPSITGDGA